MANPHDFFEWYKRKITENAPEPPADAWQNIADELDTNDVWQRVSAELDHRGGWFGHKTLYYAVPALLLLLLSGGLYFDYNDNKHDAETAMVRTEDTATIPENEAPDLKEKEAGDGSALTESADNVEDRLSNKSADSLAENSGTTPSTATIEPVTEETASGRLPENTARATPDTRRNARSAEQGTNNVQQNNTADLNSGTEASTTRAGDDSESIAPSITDVNAATGLVNAGKENSAKRDIFSDAYGLASYAVHDSMLTVSPIVVSIVADSIRRLTTVQDQPVFARTWEVGISASVKNTWLLNRMTFRGLERHTLNTTLADFGKDIGIVFRYNFSPRFSAQSEGFIISDMGQRYKQYRKGKYVTREVDLDYFHVNMLVKYGANNIFLGRPMNAHGLIGGLYFSKLKSAAEDIDGITATLPNAYSNYDYGVVMGYEYNQHLFSNLILTTGLRVNYGLNDLSTDAGSKTAAGSVDVNVALKYRIGRK